MDSAVRGNHLYKDVWKPAIRVGQGGVVEYQYARKKSRQNTPKYPKIPQIPPNIPKIRSSGHCRMSRSADVKLCKHVRNTEVHES